jgi:hypothetical protein
MSKWMKLAGVALAFGIAQPAMAANCATVSFSLPTFPQFDPITQTYTPQTITATLNRVDTTAITARLVLIDNDSGAFKVGLSGPGYNIVSASSQVVFASPYSLPKNGGDGVLVTFSGSTASASLTFSIPATPTDFVGGTVYTEPFKYSVQCFKNSAGNGSGNVTTQDDGLTAFNLPITIAKIVSITTAGPQTINFGNFTTTSQQLQVGVKSTSSINVDVSTLRGNQMVLAGAVSPYPTNSTIPYTMTLNGTSVSNGTNLTNQTRAGVAGMNWPLVLNLTGGLPTGKIAGSYSDTITLTLTPGT